MKIAQVTPIYPPALGGIGKVAHDYTQALFELGHAVEVFTVLEEQTSNIRRSTSTILSRKDMFETQPKINKFKGIFRHGHAAIIPSLLWKLRGFDVIHLHFPFYGSDLFVALAAFIWRTPLVITYHMRNKAHGWLRFLFLVHKLWEWFIFSRASAVMVSSKEYADSVKLKHRRLTVMPFWVDTDKFYPYGKQEARHQLCMPPDSIDIIFVGALDDAHYFKGVDVLLRACSALPDFFSWQLQIIGDGNRKAFYKKISEQLGLQNRVHFLGRVDDDKLCEYYRAADIHVLASIDSSEAFGLVTLEASSSGVPSIISDLPGVNTLVLDKKTGLLVAPNNDSELITALIWLLQYPKLRKVFGDNARLLVEERYAKKKILKKLVDLYEAL